MLEQNTITLEQKKQKKTKHLKHNAKIVLLFISETAKVYNKEKQTHHCIALMSLDLFNEKQSAGDCFLEIKC